MWKFYWQNWSRYFRTVKNLTCTNDINPFSDETKPAQAHRLPGLDFSNYCSTINYRVSTELDKIGFGT